MVVDKGVSLPAEYHTDPWIAGFVCELYEMFGIPVTAEQCSTKAQKIQFLWATIGISNSMKVEEPTWRAMRGRVDVEKAAEEFARRFYNKRNKMIIEEAPFFLKTIDKARQALAVDKKE